MSRNILSSFIFIIKNVCKFFSFVIINEKNNINAKNGKKNLIKYFNFKNFNYFLKKNKYYYSPRGSVLRNIMTFSGVFLIS